MYVLCKSEKIKQKVRLFSTQRTPATLAADAVVRQTVLEFGKKSSAFGVSDLACDTAGLHGYVMHQTWQNIRNELIRNLADLKLNGLPQERKIGYTYY